MDEVVDDVRRQVVALGRAVGGELLLAFAREGTGVFLDRVEQVSRQLGIALAGIVAGGWVVVEAGPQTRQVFGTIHQCPSRKARSDPAIAATSPGFAVAIAGAVIARLRCPTSSFVSPASCAWVTWLRIWKTISGSWSSG